MSLGNTYCCRPQLPISQPQSYCIPLPTSLASHPPRLHALNSLRRGSGAVTIADGHQTGSARCPRAVVVQLRVCDTSLSASTQTICAVPLTGHVWVSRYLPRFISFLPSYKCTSLSYNTEIIVPKLLGVCAAASFVATRTAVHTVLRLAPYCRCLPGYLMTLCCCFPHTIVLQNRT
jgi:hypothetical protein